MNDWHSSAHKWMINAGKFESGDKEKIASQTNYTNNKNFSEPL
jgi:hypothetical protein